MLRLSELAGLFAMVLEALSCTVLCCSKVGLAFRYAATKTAAACRTVLL